MELRQFSSTNLSSAVLETNKVLKNTYLLLSMTLFFSALCAGIALFTQAPPLSPIILIVGYFGLLFLTQAMSGSVWGLACVFLFTGFMGYTLGPILNATLHTYTNGGQIIMTALGGTGLIFISLSTYAMSTKKDFSYLGAFLFVGFITLLLASIANIFLHMPILQLVISSAVILLSSGMILFETSQIIQGGERNYILATISLYVSILNIFINLLYILSALAGNRE